jgi:hypothetical protein
MSEFYYKNLESYSEIFKGHADAVSQLMKILDDSIIDAGLPPVGRTRDLFRMVFDLLYQVDTAYKEENKVEEVSSIKFSTFMSQDEIVNVMRNVFKEEFNSFLETKNESK